LKVNSQGALDTEVLDTVVDLEVVNGPGSQVFLDMEVELLEDSAMEEGFQQALVMELEYQGTLEVPRGMESLQPFPMEAEFPEASAMEAAI
jgi:hypothetical protein